MSEETIRMIPGMVFGLVCCLPILGILGILGWYVVAENMSRVLDWYDDMKYAATEKIADFYEERKFSTTILLILTGIWIGFLTCWYGGR